MDTILVVDDEANYLTVMQALLEEAGYETLTSLSGPEALKAAAQTDLDAVLTDMKMPKMSGIELLGELKHLYPDIPVIIMTAYGTVEKAVEAMKKGAFDYILKPFKNEEILVTIAKALEHRHLLLKNRLLSNDLEKKYGFPNIVGESKAIQEILALVKRVAGSKATVLISGESGTGKELIAQLIHNESQRAQAPFVKVNCASLSDSLLESELFGHEKGAFTGAAGRHRGRFERAHGGTLLLDEITETRPAFQAQLLRVLEQMDFERVGGTESINVNVRVISTTNKDILREVEKGRLRSDLYYRIAGIRLIVPPLRERKDDLPLLIWHFVNLFAHEAKRPITSIDPVMLDVFAKYHWPGNIRQLRNVLRTSIILGSGPTLSLTDISWLLDELQTTAQTCNLDLPPLIGSTLAQLEERVILSTLHHTGGNQAKAAKVLGISDRTLRDKMKRYRSRCELQPAGPAQTPAGEFGEQRNGR
jgi:two-component system NtrC family response regulator